MNSNILLQNKDISNRSDDSSEDENMDPFVNSDDSWKDPDFINSAADSSSETESENIVPTPLQVQLENRDIENKPRSRKRKRDPSMWIKNAAKKARNCGQQYISTSKSKKIIKARTMKEPCNNTCKLKCASKFTEEARINIFESFWALGESQRQRV